MEKKSPALGVVAVLAIIGSLVYLYFTQVATGPKINLKPFENLGFVAAEETAKILGGQGRVILINEVFEAMKSPHTESQLKGFKAGLAKSSGVQLKEIKEFKRSMSDDPQHWPPGQAGRFANMAEGAGVAVLFVSLPMDISKDDLVALKECTTKLVLVTSQSPVLKKMLQERAIHTALVSRFPPKPAPEGRETPRQWFDRVYMVVTPDAMGELN